MKVRTSAEIKAAGTDLKDIPLIVLTADREYAEIEMPEAERTALLGAKIAMHQAIARNSRRGSNVSSPAARIPCPAINPRP